MTGPIPLPTVLDVRTLALALMWVFAATSSGLAAPPCICADDTEASDAIEDHACCEGAKSTPAPEGDAAGPCASGCCATELPPAIAPIERPTPKLQAPLAVSPTPATRDVVADPPATRGQRVGIRSQLRAPPPDTQTRLALVQIWRC